MMKGVAVLAGILCSLFLSLTAFAAEPLSVAVAANVKPAFDELAAAFTRQTGVAVTGSAASSGKLTAQIKNGAPFDVFLSADMEYPQDLYESGFAEAAPAVYAYGTLILWTMQAIDLDKGVAVLTAPAISKIAIANPKLAPYGRAALEALDHYRLRAAVEPRLVYGESIGQVSQYIDSGSVAIGFTAKSIVLAPATAGKGHWVEVPGDSYAPIAQGMVVLKHGTRTHPDDTRRFVDFVHSAPAHAILERYGYGLP
jgi:molybdate transport system substrate-binding protein